MTIRFIVNLFWSLHSGTVPIDPSLANALDFGQKFLNEDSPTTQAIGDIIKQLLTAVGETWGRGIWKIAQNGQMLKCETRSNNQDQRPILNFRQSI